MVFSPRGNASYDYNCPEKERVQLVEEIVLCLIMSERELPGNLWIFCRFGGVFHAFYLFSVSSTYGRLAWLGLALNSPPQQTAINNVSSLKGLASGNLSCLSLVLLAFLADKSHIAVQRALFQEKVPLLEHKSLRNYCKSTR